MNLSRLLLLLLVLLLAGCTIEISSPFLPTATPTASTPTASTPETSPAPAGYPPLPEGLQAAEMVRVVDGDTIVVAVDGREERVRLIGINTPESVDPRRPVECFGEEASANAEDLLNVPTVLLEEDASQDSRDATGRLLRYVWLEDGRMVNLEQLVGGFAAEYTYDLPYKYRQLFREAQAEAQAAGRGLWASSTCAGQFSPVGGAPAPNDRPAATVERPASCPRVEAPDAAPNAPLQIVGLDKQGEVIELRNVAAEPVNLDGWLVCSQRGGESQGGIGGSLAPGETRAFTNPGSPIWSNSNRDDAALFDPSGQLVSYWEDR